MLVWDNRGRCCWFEYHMSDGWTSPWPWVRYHFAAPNRRRRLAYSATDATKDYCFTRMQPCKSGVLKTRVAGTDPRKENPPTVKKKPNVPGSNFKKKQIRIWPSLKLDTPLSNYQNVWKKYFGFYHYLYNFCKKNQRIARWFCRVFGSECWIGLKPEPAPIRKNWIRIWRKKLNDPGFGKQPFPQAWPSRVLSSPTCGYWHLVSLG